MDLISFSVLNALTVSREMLSLAPQQLKDSLASSIARDGHLGIFL